MLTCKLQVTIGGTGNQGLDALKEAGAGAAGPAGPAGGGLRRGWARGPGGVDEGGRAAPAPHGPCGRRLGLNAVRREGGLILAVPADATLRRRVDALARGEAPERPRLGVALAHPRAARRMRAAVGLPEHDGLLVRHVAEGSPAERAGLQRGDLLVAANGVPLDGVDALFEALE